MQCNVISLFNLARPEQAPAIVETSASSLFGLTMVEYDQNVEKTGAVSKWLQNESHKITQNDHISLWPDGMPKKLID